MFRVFGFRVPCKVHLTQFENDVDMLQKKVQVRLNIVLGFLGLWFRALGLGCRV